MILSGWGWRERSTETRHAGSVARVWFVWLGWWLNPNRKDSPVKYLEHAVTGLCILGMIALGAFLLAAWFTPGGAQ